MGVAGGQDVGHEREANRMTSGTDQGHCPFLSLYLW